MPGHMVVELRRLSEAFRSNPYEVLLMAFAIAAMGALVSLALVSWAAV